MTAKTTTTKAVASVSATAAAATSRRGLLRGTAAAAVTAVGFCWMAGSRIGPASVVVVVGPWAVGAFAVNGRAGRSARPTFHSSSSSSVSVPRSLRMAVTQEGADASDDTEGRFAGAVAASSSAAAAAAASAPPTSAAAPVDLQQDQPRQQIQHGHVVRADPMWYRQYVVEVLGEDYCRERWPVLPDAPGGAWEAEQILAPPQQEQEEDAAKSTRLDEETLLTSGDGGEGGVAFAPPGPAKVEATGRNGGGTQEETAERIRLGTSVSTTSDGGSNPRSSPNVPGRPVETAEEEASSPIAAESKVTIQPFGTSPRVIGRNGEHDGDGPAATPSADVTASTVNETQGIAEPSSTVTALDETRPSWGTDGNATASHPNTTITTSKEDDDGDGTGKHSFVVYRNIVGKALSSVPLANLTALGYTVPELGRIQADALCVIVADKIRSPRMGVPAQWLVRDRDAPPEVRIVTSEGEALAMIEADGRETRERRQGRSQEEEAARRAVPGGDGGARPTSPSSRRTGRYDGGTQADVDGKGEDSKRTRRQARAEVSRTTSGESPYRDQDGFSSGRRRPGDGRTYVDDDTDRGVPRSGRKTRSTPLTDTNEGGALGGTSWRNDGQDEDDADDPGQTRRSRRRQRSLATADGSPKRIYSGRGDSQRRAWDDRTSEDPPDPNSPVWVNMDTFRRLLRKEAELRLSIIGDEFADVVDQENDWRLGLYKRWLWSLHNGVGESIVPPSRYERARRMTERRPRQSVNDAERMPFNEQPRPKRRDRDRKPRR